MNLLYKILTILLLHNIVIAQQCDKPFAISFTNQSQDSIRVRWLSTAGQDISGYQLAYGLRGTNIDSAIKSDTFALKNYTIKNLTASTQYVLFVKTICSDTTDSGWNGPFSFATYLSNPTQCGTEIILKDENCKSGGETYIIVVEKDGTLGSSLFLESIDLMLEHPWLADMEIIIENPSGSQAILSQFNGAAQNNFGVINSTCDTLTRFSSNACISISDGIAPFSGVYAPITSLVNLNDGTPAKGLWKIHFCDRSADDKGILRYIKLNLTPQLCEPIVDFYISDVSGTSVMVNWDAPFNCESLRMEYGLKGFQQGSGQGITKQVNCKNETLIVSDLDPFTEYDFYLLGDCLISLAAPSCKSVFTTSCADNVTATSFDNLDLCQNSCAINCPIQGIWTNDQLNQIDWLVWSGTTDTKNTGPDTDVNRRGNYLYVESSPSICGIEQVATLVSDCIHLPADVGCGMGFYYHMTGSDQGQLHLEISKDLGTNWDTVFMTNGSEDWTAVQIDLDDYAGLNVIMRYTAQTGSGVESDIALDQIEFYNGATFGEKIFYLDRDSDGYGVADSFLMVCSDTLIGYATLLGDCDDNDSSINPGMSEVGCNGIDENCNGLDDDNPTPPTYEIENIQNESCFGLKDGTLSLTINGNSSPYAVKWNNDSIGTEITQLAAGFYRATITDATSCAVVTPFYEVKAESKIEIEVQSILNATCTGRRDGEIIIVPTGGVQPYTYEWNMDQIRPYVIGLFEGNYHVTVTDHEGCKKDFGPIKVGVDKPLNVGTTIHKDVSCYGLENGSLTLNTTNGAEPYTYEWADGQNTNTIIDLSPGDYTATISDRIGCKSVYTATISEPDSLVQVLLNIETIKCHGDRNGRIKTTTIGGTAPYTYQWSNGKITDDISDLASGRYALEVFDNNGCIATLDTVILTEPTPLIVSIDSIINATCRRSQDAAIYLNMQGGVQPYDYFWRRLEKDTLAAVDIFAGNYGFTGVDRNECKISLPGIDIQFGNQSSPITLDVIEPYLCPNQSIGKIAATIQKATTPLNFNWSNGDNRNADRLTDTLSSLGSGDYKLTITDDEGCVSVSQIVSFDPIESFSHVISTFIPNQCKGDSTGIIGIDISGGTGSYTRLWSNGKTTPAIGKLPNGLYSLQIKDDNDCSYTVHDIDLYSLSNMVISAEIDPTIGNLNNGAIKIIPSGGEPEYTIQWQPDTLTGFTLRDLAAGNYTASIIDGLGCILDTTIVVDQISSTFQTVDKFAKIIPNPASNYIEIRGSLEVTKVDIYSHSGALVRSIDTPMAPISISDLPSGLYILQLQLPNGQSLNKRISILR